MPHVSICLRIQESGLGGCTESRMLLSHCEEADRKICGHLWGVEYIKMEKKKNFTGHECLTPNKKSTSEKIQRGNFTPPYEQISRASDGLPRDGQIWGINLKLTEGAPVLDRPAENKGLPNKFSGNTGN